MSESYKNLKIWNDAIILSVRVYELTKSFLKAEIYSLVSQLRRASVSISSNIAEGSSRTSKKDYARFIEIAIGSLHEVVSLTEIAFKLEYISKNDYSEMVESTRTLGIAIGGFRKYLLKQ